MQKNDIDVSEHQCHFFQVPVCIFETQISASAQNTKYILALSAPCWAVFLVTDEFPDYCVDIFLTLLEELNFDCLLHFNKRSSVLYKLTLRVGTGFIIS
jgi:uncharacterized membrane protein YqaE (UPF0057 family)